MTDAVQPDEAFNVGLTLTDIQNTLKIIDYAADQGAFKGWEVIDQVQQQRKRLNSFIGAALAAQHAAQQAGQDQAAI